ncbi:DedA family membrane protein, type I (SNARE domain) [Campylobacter blaseri]|uniref:VTT domain-containing protein n=1 Tax=Campylobacter blaseri TaxID=2042961 RepID=A0A2P8QZX8_9BACT|nr:DedA family protein [Campylobacter blaseri]PSM51805.1 hypothetical protein CQ405_06670 [Campylobacter blaseri]PSM53596.1 hypothetical protein CRN67_06675 [Campylobacter blaseri]QKF86408.1 DedA family membrane protein, type I (SNARE domain) [Campylobacter blaseri]
MQGFFEELMFNHAHYVYIVLFVWCIFEGEIALIIAGVLAHEGSVNLTAIIITAGLGAFCGDQIHFFIGRYNKKYITTKLSKQKRKFAIAHLLLQNYGWYIVFLQRFFYGFRAIVPISIGITRYEFKKFAFINFISSFCWAILISMLAYNFGDEIGNFFNITKQHWYIVIPIIILFVWAVYILIKKIEDEIINKRKDKYENRIIRRKHKQNQS